MSNVVRTYVDQIAVRELPTSVARCGRKAIFAGLFSRPGSHEGRMERSRSLSTQRSAE